MDRLKRTIAAFVAVIATIFAFAFIGEAYWSAISPLIKWFVALDSHSKRTLAVFMLLAASVFGLYFFIWKWACDTVTKQQDHNP